MKQNASQSLSRRRFLWRSGAAVSAGLVGQSAWAVDGEDYGIDYLESLGQPGALHADIAYIPPSQIDPSYSHVFYVNAATSGGGAQKMWVLERRGAAKARRTAHSGDFGRDLVAGFRPRKKGWRVALHDTAYWESHGLRPGQEPPYSWPVSTGRHYPGERRAGPTPLGIFNVDERDHRHRRGWGAPGMYNSIYIDLHYTSGRASGVAMHGTTGSRYAKLGRADSHGCVRMTQANADQLWALFHPGGVFREASPLWGQVPRYFQNTPAGGYSVRHGYVRDGSFLFDASGQSRLMKDGYTVLFIFFRDDL